MAHLNQPWHVRARAAIACLQGRAVVFNTRIVISDDDVAVRMMPINPLGRMLVDSCTFVHHEDAPPTTARICFGERPYEV